MSEARPDPAATARGASPIDPVPSATPAPRVVVLADDLIWATRLLDGVRRAGGTAIPARTRDAFAGALADVDGALVDLTARAYDGLDAIARAREAGVDVIAVGQHDDIAQRRAAKAAGASKVHAYRALFEHGDRELAAWLRSLAGSHTEEESR